MDPTVSFDALFRAAFPQVVVVVAGWLCVTFGFPFVARLLRAARLPNKAAAAVTINSTDAGLQTTVALQDRASSTVRNSRREPHNPDQNSRLVEIKLNSGGDSTTVRSYRDKIHRVELQKYQTKCVVLAKYQ